MNKSIGYYSEIYEGLILEEFKNNAWSKANRPDCADFTYEDNIVRCQVFMVCNLGSPIAAYDKKLRGLSSLAVKLNPAYTFKGKKCDYTWQIPAGKYRLKIEYAPCGQDNLDKVKSVNSATFEIK